MLDLVHPVCSIALVGRALALQRHPQKCSPTQTQLASRVSARVCLCAFGTMTSRRWCHTSPRIPLLLLVASQHGHATAPDLLARACPQCISGQTTGEDGTSLLCQLARAFVAYSILGLVVSLVCLSTLSARIFGLPQPAPTKTLRSLAAAGHATAQRLTARVLTRSRAPSWRPGAHSIRNSVVRCAH